MHDEGPERRARLVRETQERTGIDEAMIERLVRAFYGKIRQDPLLGPIFAAKIADWEDHIGRLCAFWSSVALMTGRYSGRPMQAHAPLPIEGAHFRHWLDLFEATAREICPQEAADHFIERAERIAESLQQGLALSRNG